jgi:putative flippase GtrA
MPFFKLFTYFANWFNEFANMLKKLAGFSIVGVISTLCTAVLMFLFHNVLHWHEQVSYVLSYIIPLFLSFVLNSIFVFNSHKSVRNIVVYFSIYLSSMLTGMVLLAIYKNFFSWDETILSYMTIPVTMAQNFTLSHFLLKKKAH